MVHQNSEAKKEMRFSDEKLYEFHNEFRQHVQRCEQRFNDGDEQFNQLITAQQKNTDAISLLIEETREIVQLHRDVQGAARVGKSIQSFIVWLVKWGAIGTGIAAIIRWVVELLVKVFP